MRDVSWWLCEDEPLRLAPEDLWRSTAALRERDGAALVAQLKRMTVPPEALLLRRMEGLLFQTRRPAAGRRALGTAAEGADRGAPPVGELGAEHAAWLSRRAR